MHQSRVTRCILLSRHHLHHMIGQGTKLTLSSTAARRSMAAQQNNLHSAAWHSEFGILLSGAKAAGATELLVMQTPAFARLGCIMTQLQARFAYAPHDSSFIAQQAEAKADPHLVIRMLAEAVSRRR
jgi:hypothetical protein